MLSLSVENQPHGQAHLVFADTQANAEKPKELALTHLPTAPKQNDDLNTHCVRY